jgi:hypothetical protein
MAFSSWRWLSHASSSFLERAIGAGKERWELQIWAPCVNNTSISIECMYFQFEYSNYFMALDWASTATFIYFEQGWTIFDSRDFIGPCPNMHIQDQNNSQPCQ